MRTLYVYCGWSGWREHSGANLEWEVDDGVLVVTLGSRRSRTTIATYAPGCWHVATTELPT